MQRAWLRRVDTQLAPLRRIEAALWNVQIAKAGQSDFVDPAQLYRLSTDSPSREKPGRMSREEYEEFIKRSEKTT